MITDVEHERPAGQPTPGWYMATEYVRCRTISPDTGPRGGDVLKIDDVGTLSAGGFAQLVCSVLLGSRGVATAALRILPGVPTTTNVVVAVDERTSR